MKTMIKDGKVSRVSEDKVDEHLKRAWVFCTKSLFKNQNVKHKKDTQPEIVSVVKEMTPADYKKRFDSIKKKKELTEEGRKILTKTK